MTLDLDKLKALCDAATPGPWDARDANGYPWIRGSFDEELGLEVTIVEWNVASSEARANAAFIAAARTAVPELIAENAALRARLATLAPVWEAAKEMRRGHEGCCTDPPCGACFRCEFDRAVDAAITAEEKAK